MSANGGCCELNILHASGRKIMLDSHGQFDDSWCWKSYPAWANALPITLHVRQKPMDIERTMRFILDQQAQFTSDVARISSILSKVAFAQERSSERHAKLEEITRTLLERQIRLEETTESVVERQSKIERTMLDLGQSLVIVANAQQRSSEILERSSEILEHNSQVSRLS